MRFWSRIFPVVALLAIAAAAACGDPNLGHLPIFGSASLCERVTMRWEDRAHACGHPAWHGNYDKCDTIVVLPHGGDPKPCFEALDVLPCDKLEPLPEVCTSLFQGWK